MSNAHVQYWIGSQSARVTDMTNAGKRGKTCEQLRWQGLHISYRADATGQMKAAQELSLETEWFLTHLDPALTYEDIKIALQNFQQKAQDGQLPAWAYQLTIESCKGIHAPKPLLTAGQDGIWSASADESGLTLRQLDDVNQWTSITHKQTNNAAYSIAAKVWDKVAAAQTMREATEILSNAGAALHSYCAMD